MKSSKILKQLNLYCSMRLLEYNGMATITEYFYSASFFVVDLSVLLRNNTGMLDIKMHD